MALLRGQSPIEPDVTVSPKLQSYARACTTHGESEWGSYGADAQVQLDQTSFYIGELSVPEADDVLGTDGPWQRIFVGV